MNDIHAAAPLSEGIKISDPCIEDKKKILKANLDLTILIDVFIAAIAKANDATRWVVSDRNFECISNIADFEMLNYDSVQNK